MKTLVKKTLKNAILAVTLFAVICLGGVAVQYSYSVGRADAEGMTIDAGVGSAGSSMSPAKPAPHETLADPVDDPAGFVGDIGKAKSKGWLGVILVGLYGATRLLGKAKKYWSKLEWFDHGHPAMVIAIAGTMLSSCIDTFFLGGTLTTVLLAALWSVVGSLAVNKKAS